MKKALTLVVSLTIVLSLTSCSFFGKKEEKKEKQAVSMAMEFAKKAKEKMKELKEEQEKEAKNENTENGEKNENIALTEKDFDAYLKSLDLALANLEKENQKIEEKAKKGDLSAMDILAFSMNSLATVFNPDEYLDKIAQTDKEKEHYKKAFVKIVEMYTYIKDKPVEQYKEETKKNIENAKEEAKKTKEEIEKLKKEHPEAAKQLEEQIDFNAMEKMAEVNNPLSVFSDSDFELYSKYQKEICAKNEKLKNEIKKLKTVFERLKK